MKLKLIPLCTQQPKTMSFRIGRTTAAQDDIYKTINSVYIEPEGDSIETPESWFTNSSESVSTITEFDEFPMESQLEEVIRGAQRSADHRLFFEPGGDTSSIVSDHDSPKLQPAKHVHSLTPPTKKSFQKIIFKKHTDQDVCNFTIPCNKNSFQEITLEDCPDSQSDQDIRKLILCDENPFQNVIIEQHADQDVRGLTFPCNRNSFQEIILEDSPDLQSDRNVRSITPKRRRRKQRRSSSALPSTCLKASVTMAVDSDYPYEDFKRSMEEMVESLGLMRDDWEALEELLGWYLKANEKSNHGYIVGAFVDLLAEIVDNSDNGVAKSTTSFSSAVTSLSSASTSDHMID